MEAAIMASTVVAPKAVAPQLSTVRPPVSSKVFRPDIEGLRGVAILFVVAFHCGIPALRSGFIGVDVFFVLSGYLITGLLVGEIEKKSRLDLLQFYARRARRLLPASALTLLVTTALACLLLAPSEIAFAGRAARATSAYASNIFFAFNAADYFAPGVEGNPMLHTWSLAVEEQFYFFWPLVVMAGLQWLRSRRALLSLLSVIAAVSFVSCVYFTGTKPTFAFYQLPARAWEFGIGGLVAVLGRQSLRGKPFVYSVLGWTGFAVVLAAACTMRSEGFPGWVAAIPAIGVLAVLVGGEQTTPYGIGRLLGSKPLQWFGKLSYSWYLWHWPFLVFAVALFPSISAPGKCAAVILALGCAALMYRYIEHPIRVQPYLVAHPRLSLGLAACVTIACLLAASASIFLAGRLAEHPSLKPMAAAVTDIARMDRHRCVSLADSSEVNTCDFGVVSGQRVVLFGDSHAIQWFDAIEKIAMRRGWLLTTVVKSGCPAASIHLSHGCSAWREAAFGRIAAMKPSLVIIANSSGYVMPDRSTGEPRSSLTEWGSALRSTLARVASNRTRVALIRDTPRPGFDVPTCLARKVRNPWLPGTCDIPRSSALLPALYEAESEAMRGMAMSLIDMNTTLCDGGRCATVTREGAVMYRDDNHLTGSFAASLAPMLERQLAR
jgi:peptidoglycan/LPS O-acetylase OafA/YrhL